MILSDIKRYLQTRRQASLADIALHFDANPEAVRGMFEHWIRKGRVEKQLANASCGSTCTQCDPAATKIYLWRDAAAQTGEQPLTFDRRCPGT